MEVGDSVEITFTATTGATVTASWVRPDRTFAAQDQAVPESPAGTGRYPATFVDEIEGTWQALFRASGAASLVELYYVRFRIFDDPIPLATVDEYTDLFGPLSAAAPAWPARCCAPPRSRSATPTPASKPGSRRARRP
jgi:hypothetical protein